MQVIDDGAHGADGGVDGVEHALRVAVQARVGLGRARVQQRHIDAQHHQVLAQVVMNVERDAPAFLFLDRLLVVAQFTQLGQGALQVFLVALAVGDVDGHGDDHLRQPFGVEDGFLVCLQQAIFLQLRVPYQFFAYHHLAAGKRFLVRRVEAHVLFLGEVLHVAPVGDVLLAHAPLLFAGLVHQHDARIGILEEQRQGHHGNDVLQPFFAARQGRFRLRAHGDFRR